MTSHLPKFLYFSRNRYDSNEWSAAEANFEPVLSSKISNNFRQKVLKFLLAFIYTYTIFYNDIWLSSHDIYTINDKMIEFPIQWYDNWELEAWLYYFEISQLFTVVEHTASLGLIFVYMLMFLMRSYWQIYMLSRLFRKVLTISNEICT